MRKRKAYRENEHTSYWQSPGLAHGSLPVAGGHGQYNSTAATGRPVGTPRIRVQIKAAELVAAAGEGEERMC